MGSFGIDALAVSLLKGRIIHFGIIIASIFYAAFKFGGQTLQIDYKLDKELYILYKLLL